MQLTSALLGNFSLISQQVEHSNTLEHSAIVVMLKQRAALEYLNEAGPDADVLHDTFEQCSRGCNRGREHWSTFVLSLW